MKNKQDLRDVSLTLATLFLCFGTTASADPAGKVDICHKPGERNQRILNIDLEKDGAKHFGHGDYVVEPEVCDGQDSDCDKPINPDNDVDCSDAFACTVDTCGGVSGCMNMPDDTLCEDGEINTTDTCVGAGGDANGCVFTPIQECGNGILEAPEECDDGNTTDGDGCSAFCEIEAFCGDGNLDPGEQCDDGNNDDGDGCSASCAVEVVECPCEATWNNGIGAPPLETSDLLGYQCGAVVAADQQFVVASLLTDIEYQYVDAIELPAIDGDACRDFSDSDLDVLRPVGPSDAANLEQFEACVTLLTNQGCVFD
jgi:cysteine-rich repeat protein